MKKLLWTLLLCAATTSVFAENGHDGFETLFDGQSLRGWHVSAQTGHSGASQHKSGGKWVVEKGAIVGSQDIPGNGGIVITDEQFGDFEVVVEMNNDFGPDSGLFLRSTETGKAWQAMIDYHSNGNVMGIYGEGLGGKPHIRNYEFIDSPSKIREIISPVGPSLRVLPTAWGSFWRHGQWNELRARIVGNPPEITTWINGVKISHWKETELRHPEKGGIALQVHGGGNFTHQFVRYRNIRVKRLNVTPDNTLNEEEKKAGWKLLFDGKTYAGWMNSNETEPKTPIVDGAINPHRAGAYMVVHKESHKNYVLKMDFKISSHCNSGIFLRTSTLKPAAGKDVGHYGIEVAIDDTYTADFHDTGAIYDLSKPTRNAMRPVGEWNHIEITSKGSTLEVVLNGEKVNSVDLAKFTEPNKRPDGSAHKFDIAYKDHPQAGYIGLQDHGGACWYKNIKLLPLP